MYCSFKYKYSHAHTAHSGIRRVNECECVFSFNSNGTCLRTVVSKLRRISVLNAIMRRGFNNNNVFLNIFFVCARNERSTERAYNANDVRVRAAAAGGIQFTFRRH